MTLTAMCYCPQTVCQHCAHSHKPEIPNPDYRDITTTALSVSLLIFHPFSISSCHPFLLPLLQNMRPFAVTWNCDISLHVFVSCFISLFHCHAAFAVCTSESRLWGPGPSLTPAAVIMFGVLFTQRYDEHSIPS